MKQTKIKALTLAALLSLALLCGAAGNPAQAEEAGKTDDEEEKAMRMKIAGTEVQVEWEKTPRLRR